MAEADSGLMGSLKRLLSTLLTIATTRLELLANELQEERLRLTQMVVMGLFALFCAGLGILFLSVFIMVLFWDDHRLASSGLLSILFFSLTGIMAILLRNKAKSGSKLFSASLAELARDKQQLEADHE